MVAMTCKRIIESYEEGGMSDVARVFARLSTRRLRPLTH